VSPTLARARRARATGPRLGLLAALLASAALPGGAAGEGPRFPDILLVTVDTLRADHLGAWGYPRPTSPAIDRLVAAGARFDAARTVEPLTTPALASLLTSVPPHRHGATRNGLSIREGLPSLPRLLARRGYRTAAVVGNWTLKARLSGLAPHWQSYDVVLSRKRWFGLMKGEATAVDLTDRALAWVRDLRESEPGRPYFLWVHYVEPHAPYRFHAELARRLGIPGEHPGPLDRYDTEIAAVDLEIGRLIGGLDAASAGRSRLTLFLADHGEAFGEHGEHGHGRVLHEPTVRVPLAFTWPGRVEPATIEEPATLLDVAPTVLELLGLPKHPFFAGRSIAALTGGDPVRDPVCFQAHKGAVQSIQRDRRARLAGLLEVGVLSGDAFEATHLANGQRRLFDLAADPRELHNEAAPGSPPSPRLAACVAEIRRGLEEADRFVPPPLDADEIEQLRALGYLD